MDRRKYIIVDIDDIKIKMCFSHPTQHAFVKKIKKSRHEHHLLTMWKRNVVLNKGDILDLGGYSGIFGLIAAKASPDSKVYIFEPDPVNYKHVSKNIALNNLVNVTPVKAVVSNKTEQVSFQEHQGGEAGSISEKGCLKIKSYALNDFIESNDIKPRLIKMDVEGAEYLALSGMKEYLKKTDDLNILLELHYDLLKKYSHTAEDIFKLLDELHFKYIYLDKNQYNEHYWVYPVK
ncbi:MAG: FkbM family methyltransferase [Patescibacteria group bacterium]